jgi:hypothetical protein
LSEKHILDPLWITKGSSGLDPEYYKYVLLAANQKYRNNLNEGDLSNFYEILFHSLNLNNLIVEGSLFNFNMTPVWNNERLIIIRDHLRKVYQLPEDVLEIFKNANYLLNTLMLDYLFEILDVTELVKSFFVNPQIHREKEVFMVINAEGERLYDIWKIRMDKRYKFGYKISHIQDVELSEIKENALHEAIMKEGNPELNNMDANTNVLFSITNDGEENEDVAIATAMSILFSRGISKDLKFEPSILSELYELLAQERVLPFTMKNWV